MSANLNVAVRGPARENAGPLLGWSDGWALHRLRAATKVTTSMLTTIDVSMWSILVVGLFNSIQLCLALRGMEPDNA